MSWEFPEDFDPSKLDGADHVAPGKYHFQVQEMAEDAGQNNELLVKADVLGGTDESQIGKVHHEYFTKPYPGCKKGVWSRPLQLAVALGLTTVEELQALKEAGRRPVIHWSDAVGRQFCGELHEETYEGKARTKLGFDIWAIGSSKAAGIPLNKGMLEKSSGDDPFGGGDGGSGGENGSGGGGVGTDDPLGDIF